MKSELNFIISNETIYYPIFSKETFFQIHEDADKEDYTVHIMPCTVPYTFMNDMETVNGKKIDKVKFILIDEEYLEYKNISKFDNDEIAKNAYLIYTSDESAKRLWNKRVGNYCYDVILPLIFNISELNKQVLNPISAEGIKVVLSKKYKYDNQDILIFPKLFHLEHLESNWHDMISEASLQEIDYFEKISLNSPSVLGLCIKFKERGNCILTKEMAQEIEKYNIMSDFTKSETEKILKLIRNGLDFKGTVTMSQRLASTLEVKQIVNDFYKVTGKNAEM